MTAEVEAHSIGQGEQDSTVLDVNELQNLMAQQHLRQNNHGQDLLINTTNDIAGQSRRRLPPQYNNAKMRLK